MRPAEVSDLYAASIPSCMTIPASTTDVSEIIGAFVDRYRHTPRPDKCLQPASDATIRRSQPARSNLRRR